MIGRKKYIMVAIAAFIGNIVFAFGFGLLTYITYTAESIRPTKLSIGIIGFCFFAWRAYKMLMYIIRQTQLLKAESE